MLLAVLHNPVKGFELDVLDVAGLAETVAFLSDIGSRAFRNEKDEATAWICFHRLFYAACSIA